MKPRLLLLLAAFVTSCMGPAPYVCLAPVNLNFSQPLDSYDFAITGRIEDGTEYASRGRCPGTFSGGSCDENGISLRDLDNLSFTCDLQVLVDGQAVFAGKITVADIEDSQCTSGGTRDADVVF